MRATELSFLLELSKGLAAVPDRLALLQTLHELAQPEFGFQSLNLFVRTPDGQQLLDWATEQPGAVGPSGQLLAYPASGFVGLFDTLARANGPVVLPYDAAYFRLLDDATLCADTRRIVQVGGYRECLGTLLRAGGQVVGYLAFNSSRKGAFQSAHLEVFQALAEQVAAAVAGLVAREAAAARAQENTTLLEITELIAQVKAPCDLLRLMVENIKPLFGFHDCGIFVVSADGQTHKDLAAALPEISPSEWNTALVTISANLPHPGSPVEWAMTEVATAGQPVLFDFQDLAARFPDYPQFEGGEVLALGYRDCLATNLTVRGQAIGFFCLNARQKGFFQPAAFPLFQSIAHTVAIAVANILANEEIVEREREKALLLSLSEDMSTIRDRHDLFKVILEKIKPIVGFDDAVISVYSSDYTTYKHFVTASPPERVAHPLYQEIVGRTLPLADNPDEYVLAQLRKQGMLRWDTVAIKDAYPTHFIGGFLEENGLFYNVYSRLSWAGSIIGFMNFHFHEEAAIQPRRYALYKAIADQAAGAVANILANEEILAREQEKTLHLAVTTALTSADDWTTKLATVAREIGRVVAWDNCQFTFPDRGTLDAGWRQRPDGTEERLSADTARRELGLTPLDWQTLNRQTAPLQQQAAAYDEADVMRLAAEYGLVLLMHEHWGVRALLYLPVWQNNELLAVLRLAATRADAFPPAQLAQLQRLAPQLALGLENLFSFEKIEQQERERTQQLALNNALVTIKDSFSLYHAVARELDPLVRLDSLSAWTFTADNLLHFTVLRKDEAGAFQDITETARASYAEMDTLETEALLRRELPPAVYTGDAFAAMCAQHQVYRVRRDQFGVASTLELPLPVRNGLRSLLVLGSRVAFAFTPDDLRQVLPFAPQIALAVENMVAHEELNQLRKQAEQEKVYLAEEIKTTHNFEEMVGVSATLHGVFRQIGQVAGTEATVLITGETGTGKELIARTLHAQSTRHARTLIKLNCAALPASLIESELFGHEKGAFTGAIDRRIGKFELAQGSTIFLDEIGELPLELQSKLLRVLQEREFERLGGNKVLRADVRVVAATNRNLAQEVAAGRFRADLYYRLSVFPIHMPALRERPEDIPLLAQHFARKFSRTMGKPYRGIKEAALDELLTYNWPGNIRELENLVEQAVIVCPGPLEWSRSLRPLVATALLPDMAQAGGRAAASTLKEEMDALERNRILTALNECKGRIRGKRGAALLLGLKPTTLESKMEKLGIRKEQVIVSG